MNWDLDESIYRVEISGWDATENFFVEKSDLKWDSEGGKEITLSAMVREGSIVFIRLLQPVASENNYPITYHVSSVGPRDARGLIRVGLEPLRPRHSLRNLPFLDRAASVMVS
jgi:hypothetical protein